MRSLTHIAAHWHTLVRVTDLLWLASQACERLTAMNDPEKGGSAYLQAKIAFARDAIIKQPETPPEKPPEGATSQDKASS